ncbi:MAG TPA: hypothetical protein VFW87_22675, partial [Pirellulales bacterium]|nr:hypothetical protein [Pirellulales bacterium]
RQVALKIFKGVHMLEESDTYLMILEQGEERARRGDLLMFGEERFGAADETVRAQLANVTDLERLKRMVRRAATAGNWKEILDTP